MYPFNDKVSTTKKSAGKNSKYWIVIHHTAGGTYKGNMTYLSTNPVKASVHFVIWEHWEIGKIGDPDDILRHAGNGSRWGMDNVNYGFLGIEVVGFGDYNVHQLIALTDLVEYLMWNFKTIEKVNIIRHSDCTQSRDITRKKILRDWKRPVKKIDIDLKFFGDNEHFLTRRDQLTPRKESRFWSI